MIRGIIYRLSEKRLTMRLYEAIQNDNYDSAVEVANKMQDIAYYYCSKKKTVPAWIVDGLGNFNKKFGWLKLW